MGEHWSDDGGIYASLTRDSARHDLGHTDKWELTKEVLMLAGSAWATGFLLSGTAAYRQIKNPAGEKGMPTLGLGPVEPGFDWVVAGLGLLGGILFGDFLGPTLQTVVIGAGIGGIVTAGVHQGAWAGAKVASGGMSVKGLVDSTVDSVKGLFSVGAHGHSADREKDLSPEAAATLREYEGN